jgi:folate-dependent phosphoribosylglycinamide formyltransferase PurN
MDYFEHHPGICVEALLADRMCPAMDAAHLKNIQALLIGEDWGIVKEMHSDCFILAGFLTLVPTYILECHKGKFINIHPSLLPDFGGKGFYGLHIHRAVVQSGKSITGLTIHHAGPEYDTGTILHQATMQIPQGATPEQLMMLVQQKEKECVPSFIENHILSNN